MNNPTDPAKRFRLLIGVALAAAVVLIPLALWYIWFMGSELRLHLIVAVSLAITFTLVLAATLMGLLFFSSESGHDQRVHDENLPTEPDVWRED
jgi:hypothetical protein